MRVCFMKETTTQVQMQEPAAHVDLEVLGLLPQSQARSAVRGRLELPRCAQIIQNVGEEIAIAVHKEAAIHACVHVVAAAATSLDEKAGCMEHESANASWG
jgi:hypothetical protein